MAERSPLPHRAEAPGGTRRWRVTEPDKVWAGDITYIATDKGWLFLAVVIDLFSRQVVGWSLREDMTRDIVIDALRMAWFKRHPGKHAGLIFHSDRGSQYASKDFRDVLSEYGITSSMSRKGNCWDNACSETLFGSLKVERLHGQRFKSRPPWSASRGDSSMRCVETIEVTPSGSSSAPAHRFHDKDGLID